MSFRSSPAPSTANGLLLRALRRRRRLVLPGLYLMTQWQICEALVPIAIGIIVEVAIIPLDWRALVLSLLGLIALFTVLSLSYRFGSRLSNTAQHLESHALRVEVARVPLNSSRTLSDVNSGEVLSLSSADADVASMIFRQIALGGSAVIGIIGISVYLLWTDLLVGLIVLIGVPLSLLFVALPSRAISRHSVAQQTAIGLASRRAGDIMQGLRVLKAGGGERWAADQYRDASQRAAAAGIVTAERSGRVQGIGSLGMAVVLALVLLAAGHRVLTGEMAIGALVSVVGVAVFFEEPVRVITQMVSVFAQSHGAAQRIIGFLNSAPADAPGTEVPTGPHLQFQHLELPDGRRFDLDVKAGSLVALVAEQPAAAAVITRAAAGHGAGADAVLLGGRPRSQLVPELAEHLIVAPHHVDLFVGTVRSNITMHHDAEPVSPEVLEASATAEMLEHFSDGLDHRVQEGGRNLSGGQRQRIALARALHADPEVLILHDPTSAVDAVTEWEIAQAVQRFRKERLRREGRTRTTLIVTSSPPFLATADIVVYLSRSGQPLTGTHQELRETSTAYREAVDR